MMESAPVLLGMARAYQLSQALYVAAKLGVADELAAGPRDASALALAVGAQPDELRRVLRALVASGVFAEDDEGRFELNPVARGLCAGAPERSRDIVISFCEEMYQAFGRLLHTVRTGETAFDSLYGQPLFEYYASHPEAEAIGAARMNARSLAVARELAQADLWEGMSVVVDVGAGIGTVLAECLTAVASLRGVLLERPTMIPRAEEYLAEHNVLDRCELVGGDFFESVPSGGDLYVLKTVLHDWNDERCVTILNNCRDAMPAHAKVAIVEFVLPDHMTAAPALVAATLLDLIMMAYAGGRERTAEEWARLAAQSGLRIERLVGLAAGPSVVLAGRA